MRKPRPALVIAVTLLALIVAIPAHAVSNRIFMSTNGNNASDCANPLTPCLTFAGALAQVNPGGEVIAEATGGYGPLNITQAVTISGPPGVVIYSGLQVNVNAPGATVVLRGLTIDGTGAAANGINVVSVGTLYVESCVITGFTGSTISAGNGIYFASPSSNLSVKDTTVRNNGWVGIWLHTGSSANASVENCRIEGNTSGLNADDVANVTVRASLASGNSNSGLLAQSGGKLNMENCVVANNVTGIVEGGSSVVVSGTTVTDNAVGLSNPSPLHSRGNNIVRSNGTEGSFTDTFPPD